MLFFHISNDFEKLFDLFWQNFAKKVSSSTIFEKQIIIVQSQEIRKYLSVKLAEKLKVFTSFEFFFLNNFIDEVFKIYLNFDGNKKNTADIWLFEIFKILSQKQILEKEEFLPIAHYVQDTNNTLKIYQISAQIAYTFEKYTIYRPKIIIDWEHKKDENWQSILWNKLKNKDNKTNLFLKMLEEKEIKASKKIKNIHIFNTESIPKLHLQIFDFISQKHNIDLFSINPCSEYWGDIKKKKDNKQNDNLLLAANGKIYSDFFETILEENFNWNENFQFKNKKTKDSLLSCIQNDILTLRKNDTKIQKDDKSIQIHSSCSKIREVEILYDNILDILNENEDIGLQDILVMVPNISDYLPYILSSFSDSKIDFSIAGANFYSFESVLKCFFLILNLNTLRFSKSCVLSILNNISVRKKFGLDDDIAINKIEKWLSDLKIKWGINANYKETFDLPKVHDGTWEELEERLLLCIITDEEKLFNNILPYDDISETDIALLEKFLFFLKQLKRTSNKLNKTWTIDEWCEILLNISQNFFQEDNLEIISIRNILYNLKKNAKEANFDDKVNIKIILNYLIRKLEKHNFSHNFYEGKVNFCEIAPSKCIPSKVICLLGLNDDFPRKSRFASFDFIAQNPKKQDQDKKDEDRHTFLEALTFAKKIFYLSYIGQNAQDASPMLPSKIIEELLFYIKENFNLSSDNLITKHKSYPFNPAYFSPDDNLISYDEQNFKIAKSTFNTVKTAQRNFVSNELKNTFEQVQKINITDFINFFKNPSSHFMGKILNIYMEDDFIESDQGEPFKLGGLDLYQLKKMILYALIENKNLSFDFVKKKLDLPHQNIGISQFEKIKKEMEAFKLKISSYIKHKKDDIYIEKQIHKKIILTGNVKNIFGKACLNVAFNDKNDAKDIIETWINHLILCGTSSTVKKSVLIYLSKISCFEEITQPLEILENLAEKYIAGSKKAFCFYPNYAKKYYEAMQKEKTKKKDIIKDILKDSNLANDKEGKDLKSFKFLFKNFFPEEEFMQNANDIFYEIFNNKREGKWTF